MAKIILAVLILGGASYFIFFADKKDDQMNQEVESLGENMESSDMEQNKTEDFEEKTTLSKLMKNGGNYECTFSHSTQIGESSGVVYISGKKIRGDFVSKVSVSGVPSMGDIKTYMISDGESVYTWSSMSSDGYKASVAKDENVDKSESNIPSDQELDYKCVKWSVDNSKFVLPTDITFKTI